MGPCQLKVCRICFAMDCQLHLLHENIPLYKGYEAVTGLILANEEGLPPFLCTNCADQQTNYVRFMNKSLQAHLMLLDILKNHGHISVESIRDVIKANDCDSDNKNTEEERTISNFQIDVKCEDVLVDPIATECDRIKIEFMSDDDLVGDEGGVIEINVIKEEVIDEASVSDNEDGVMGTGGDALDDGLPSGQEDKLNTVEAREGVEVTEDLKQTEDTEVNEKTIQNVTLSSDLFGYENDNEIRLSELNNSKSMHRCDNKTKSNINKMHLSEYTCNICKKSFSRKFILNRHMLIHSGHYRYVCTICNRSFFQQYNLNRHMRLHSVDKPYSCEVCNKSFNSNSDVIDHKRIHSSNKPYSCDVCRKSFRCQSFLLRHVTSHSADKPYTCEICEKRLARKTNLERHMLIHSSKKPYSCEICSNSYRSKSEVKSHMQVHSSNKYQCDLCSKSYRSKRDVIRHRLIHSGVRNECSVCKKSFSRKQYLQIHMLIHTGVKPYSCDVCKKSFRQKSTLRSHIMKHSLDYY